MYIYCEWVASGTSPCTGRHPIRLISSSIRAARHLLSSHSESAVLRDEGPASIDWRLSGRHGTWVHFPTYLYCGSCLASVLFTPLTSSALISLINWTPGLTAQPPAQKKAFVQYIYLGKFWGSLRSTLGKIKVSSEDIRDLWYHFY
jgi:hypothetical protein